MSAPAPPGDGPNTPPADDAVEVSAEGVVEVLPECAECHSPLDADQTYCLVCGAPTPRAPHLRPRRKSAGLWIALALAALAVAAGALAWVLAHRDDDRRTGTTVSTMTAVSVPTNTGAPPTIGGLPPDPTLTLPTAPTETVDTTPGTTPTSPFETVTGPTTPPPTEPDPTTETQPIPTLPDPGPVQTDVASDWPPGTSAWTVIIASTTDAQSAIDTRDGAESRGYSPGILHSSDHRGLVGGYFVVYVGQYPSRAAVIRRVAELKQHYPKAYPRYINA